MKNKKRNRMPLELSIVIPVYNEKENILKALDEIKQHIKVPHEIIIVYDFDRDTTLPIIRKVKNRYKNLLVIKNFVASGPSGAIRTGISQSRASRVLVTMADLCDDISQVKEVLSYVPKSAAVVSFSRYSKGGKQQLRSSLKVWAPRTAGYLLKTIAGIPTYDPTNSFKLYSKEMLNTISLESTISFSVTLEIVVRAHAQGYHVIETPTIWRDRQHGKTHFKLGRSLIAYFPWFLYALAHQKPFQKTTNQKRQKRTR